MRKYVGRRLDAVLAVADRLVDDLKATLSSDAPRIDKVFAQAEPAGSMSRDGEVLYQHARLMHAAQVLENELLMAMPAHQREASFASARMEGLLTGAERTKVLLDIQRGELDGRTDVLVLRLSRRSSQTKIKEGDFTWSLLPESFLHAKDRTLASIKREHVALCAPDALGPIEKWEEHKTVRDVCKVAVIAFDRIRNVAVVSTDGRFLPVATRLGILDFALSPARQAILDPLVIDFFVRKRLLPTLRQIRNPPLARSRPLFANPALTRLRLPKPRPSDPVPAERFIWDADVLAEADTCRSGDRVLAAAREAGIDLTVSQAKAVRRSVEKRLALLWGPPGTGKSTTAVALLRRLLAEAAATGEPIRIAITGPTWVAIDTVARKLPKVVGDLGLADAVGIARLSSSAVPDGAPELRYHHVATDGGAAHAALVDRLASRSGSVVVAGTAQQLAKLSLADAGPMRPFFDFMLVDEASQMSVALAVTAFGTLAAEARVTVVGDNLQMPPIQPVAPPEGAEHLVGSIYDFYRRYRDGEPGARGIDPVMLDLSYRSNAEIVAFVRLAGYREELKAKYPALRMRLATPLAGIVAPDTRDAEAWNACLPAILAPDRPLVAVIHSDEYSSQRNEGEALLVAALVWALRGRLLPAEGEVPLDAEAFYRDGVGIVTPHRAQQAAVVNHLLEIGSSPAEH